MSDPSRSEVVSQADVDAQGRLPVSSRFYHAVHREINSSKNTCGAVPCASRLPDARLTVCVLGGETQYGSHIVRGLINPAYSPAFEIRIVELSVMRQCNTVAGWVELLRGVHTVIAADCCIVQQQDGRCIDTSDDQDWQTLIESFTKAGVRRFIPSPFEWDLQLTGPIKKGANELPALVRRATERQSLLRSQKELDYTLISVGVLTEQLFSPLAGVDVQAGVVRAPAGLGWQTLITTTTLDDIARMLPEILLSRESHNATVRLCSATVSYLQIAQIIEQTTGKVTHLSHAASGA